MKHDTIIAIDPDVEKSGVAFLQTSDRRIHLESLSFPELLNAILEGANNNKSIVVVVEASWMIRSNWHLSKFETKQRAAAKGYDVGRNHETGRKVVEMCKHWGIEIVEHAPLRKCWKGKDGKITQGEIEQFIPGFPKRTNQDVRDAALLAWCYANFPIRLKCL